MQVSMQEFKSHLSHYVGEAQSGHLIELTSHRKVVARIIGVSSTASAGVYNLLSAGLATWQGGKPSGGSLNLQKQGKLVSTLVIEGRG